MNEDIRDRKSDRYANCASENPEYFFREQLAQENDLAESHAGSLNCARNWSAERVMGSANVHGHSQPAEWQLKAKTEERTA